MNNINVIISEDKEKAYMVFNFEKPIKIEITSDDKKKKKKMFYKILEQFVDNQDITFVFNKEKEDLYSEVVEKYVSHLNSELNSLKNNFNNPQQNEYKD